MNASAAIVAGGRVKKLKEAMVLSRYSIDSGLAEKKLNDLCHQSYS
jgi:anthranilate phosphoribosyltransferase